ncbi:Uncharacterised protein [Raoultella terrigena]|uniref:Uncharacterized protein n=1 Tax=Raoultella terrigena TaxID=577 RepID=A0A4U9CYI7_RAOTE|nr:Uncharacterised protein [Raoultella terrigena]
MKPEYWAKGGGRVRPPGNDMTKITERGMIFNAEMVRLCLLAARRRHAAQWDSLYMIKPLGASWLAMNWLESWRRETI